jgi:hypothetical protein
MLSVQTNTELILKQIDMRNGSNKLNFKKKLRGLSPLANYTDRAKLVPTFLRTEGATWLV